MEYDIGGKIKALRLKKNCSQSELCGDFINRTILSRIENNKLTPSIPQLEHIANELGVPITYFFTNSINDNNRVEDNYNSNLYEMYKNHNYYDIIKFPEYYQNEFNDMEDINKYFYLGMAYVRSNMASNGLKPLKKYINRYLKSSESIQKQYAVNFAYAINALFVSSYNKKADYPKIEENFLTAIKLLLKYNETGLPINYIIHYDLGILYNDTMQFSKSINLLEKLLNGNSDIIYRNITPHLHSILSEAYLHIGDCERALKELSSSEHIILYNNVKDKRTNIFYINYLYIIRRLGKFQETLEMIEKLKDEYSEDKEFYVRLMMSQITVYFNLGEYDKMFDLAMNIKVDNSPKVNRTINSGNSEYYFMIGHINCIKNKFKEAKCYLKLCEKNFLMNDYINDLVIIYSDLYKITQEEQYREKLEYYKNQPPKIHIYVEKR